LGSFLENRSGGVGVVPEVLVPDLGFEFFQSVVLVREVKDNLRAV